MYGSLTFSPHSNLQFLMADISFNFACKGVQIAQFTQINQLFQLLHLVHIGPQLPWVELYANEEKCKQ